MIPLRLIGFALILLLWSAEYYRSRDWRDLLILIAFGLIMASAAP